MIVKSQTMMEVQLNPTLYNGAYHIRCNGGHDGAINTIVIGGEEPFAFLWSNGATTEDVDQLSAGTYTVTVTQNGGSTVSASVQLREPGLLDPSLYSPTYAGGTNISINGGQDGGIQLTGQGGTPPYEYLWSNSSQEQDLYDLMAGTYTVTVTDANACTQTRSITLTEPAPLSIVSITSPDYNGYNLPCAGGSNGSINLTVSGGVAPYEFLWNNGSFDEDPTGLTAGEYAIRVTDQNGTQAEASITLTQPDALSLELSPFVYPNNYHISLFGGYDGSIVTTAGGGVTPYNFLWNDGSTLQNRTTLNHGNKSVTLTDANGCVLGAEVLLLEPASADWMMGGNENTNPATQFIGTKDSVDVVFRTNNQEQLRLKADGGIGVASLAGQGYTLVYADPTGALKGGSAMPVLTTPWLTGGNDQVTGSDFIGPVNGEDFIIKTAPGSGLQATEHFRLTHGGYVGIGTNTPYNKLDVTGSMAIGTGFAGVAVAPVNSLIVSGNIGIGVTGPVEKLEVDGNVRISALATGASTLVTASASGQLNTLSMQGAGIGLWQASGTSIFNANSGNVGIGTSSPADRLQVNEGSNNLTIGSAYGSGLSWGTSYIGFNASRNGNAGNWQVHADGNPGAHNGGSVIYSNVEGSLYFSTVPTYQGQQLYSQTVTDAQINQNTRLFIHSEGNIGVGTLQPSSLFHLAGNNPVITLEDNSSAGDNHTGISTLTTGAGITWLSSTGGVCVMINPTQNNDFNFCIGKPGNNGAGISELFRVNKDGIASARAVKVTLGLFPDYVFDKNYSLPTLEEVKTYTEKNHHLPGVPSSVEIDKNGLDLGQMQSIQMEKIENIYLYLMQLKKENELLKIRIANLENK